MHIQDNIVSCPACILLCCVLNVDIYVKYGLELEY
jgi:hypothetical protein